MLENSISSLDKLQNRLNNESCLPKQPLMKLGEGTAPELNYNLPESSSFSVFGDVPLAVDSSFFKPETKQAPVNNVFEYIKGLDSTTLSTAVKQASQSAAVDNRILVNSEFIRSKSLRRERDYEAYKTAITESQSQLSDEKIVEIVKAQQMPVAYRKLGGFKTEIKFLAKPTIVKPRLYVIEEYVTASYIGQYGAGRAVKTFSLLPGEKTKISIRTYKDITTTQASSKNVIDSFSEESTEEFENLLQEESADSVNTTTSSSRKLDANLSGKIFGINLKTGASASKSITASRTSNITSLSKAFTKHVATSNSNRKVEVNTSTSYEKKEGEEESIVREFENINQSRTLNFIFRQLLQEYVSITYLANIKIAYTNGYMESVKVVDIEDIDNLLAEVILPENQTSVKNVVLKNYQKIMDYRGCMVNFLESKTISFGASFNNNQPIKETFWSKKFVSQTYNENGLLVKIPGVILEVKKNILRTSSVIVDSLLGQGQALDCFSLKAQDAVATSEGIKNMERLQKIEIIESSADKAEAYQKIYALPVATRIPQLQLSNSNKSTD